MSEHNPVSISRRRFVAASVALGIMGSRGQSSSTSGTSAID